MYKIDIDPITNCILGYTLIKKNTITWEDDFLVEDSDIGKYVPGYYINQETLEPEERKDEIDEIDSLTEQINNLLEKSEHDYLIELVVDKEKSLSEARELIKSRRLQIESLQTVLDIAKTAKEAQIKKHWMEKDKEKDALLNPIYYSAVVMVIKHENRYLQEWLDWHLALGFDHIYLYDNGTKEKVTEIIKQNSQEVQDKITVIEWSEHHTHLQQDAYTHFMNNFKEDVRWGLFIDSDEFVRFTDGVTTNVNDFLKDYEDYTEIWGYEVEYNANGQEEYEDKPVRERFTQQTDAREGFYWKNFVQPNRIDGWLMHYAQYNPDKHFLFKNEQKNQDLFVIDHYYTKSWEEWIWKITERGGADPKYHKELQEFFYYNPNMEYLNTGENAVQTYEEDLQVGETQIPFYLKELEAMTEELAKKDAELAAKLRL